MIFEDAEIEFENAKQALAWYAKHKKDPIPYKDMAETIKRNAEKGYTPEPNYMERIDIEDIMLAVFDIDKFLGRFRPRVREALVIYGICDKGTAVAHLMNDGRFKEAKLKSMSARTHYRFLDNILRQLEKLLNENNYIKEEPWIELPIDMAGIG